MDKRLLLIDGSNLLFQMFFGMPSRIVNGQGKPIQGTLGFVGALLKIVRRFRPAWLVVLFDGQHENVRAALNADYKSNRVNYSQVSEEENPFSQIDKELNPDGMVEGIYSTAFVQYNTFAYFGYLRTF